MRSWRLACCILGRRSGSWFPLYWIVFALQVVFLDSSRDKSASAMFANVGFLQHEFFAIRAFQVGLWRWAGGYAFGAAAEYAGESTALRAARLAAVIGRCNDPDDDPEAEGDNG